MRKLIIAFSCILFALGCASKEDRKPYQTYVVDEAGIIPGPQQDSLSERLRAFRHEMGPHIAIFTIDSLGEKTIEDRAIDIVEEWKFGRKGIDDGLLILVSYFDRQVRIEVGYGLELIIRDDVAARIIREDLAPYFRNEEFGKGLLIATDHIKELIRQNKDKIGEKWKPG